MPFSFDLLFEAVVFGILLGCFYAAVSIGLSVSFGLLDVPHVAHPAIMVFGSYCTYLLGRYGLDPISAAVVLMPFFFVLGMGVYRFYYETFERRGSDAGVRGIAFFFGVALIIEVGLILASASTSARSRRPTSARASPSATCASRCASWWSRVALVLMTALTLYMSKTFTGRAIKAVAQDEQALRLMGANPMRIKQWAFGIATGVSALAGAMLIIIGPVEPALDRVYIGARSPSWCWPDWAA
jgi:branched-chain amino acid transport system permease protein